MTKADFADSATHAINADKAAEADRATEADRAIEANHAITADESNISKSLTYDAVANIISLVPKSSLDLLWSNPDTSVEFATQEIAIDNLSQYSLFVATFWYSNANTDPIDAQTIVCVPNQGSYCLMIISNKIMRRRMYVTDTAITFTDSQTLATYGSNMTNPSNTYCIPYCVYGIKLSKEE